MFFVAGLGLEAVLALAIPAWRASEIGRRAAIATLAGLVAFGILALAVFVLPNWSDYRFYNWQISVTRKPSYDLKSLLDRLTWFPVVHDIFTRMWFVVFVAACGLMGLLARWRQATAGERLLAIWTGLGTLELVLHDAGNERRFIFFIPALVALAAIVLGRDRRLLPAEIARISRRQLAIAMPILLFALYVVAGVAGAARPHLLALAWREGRRRSRRRSARSRSTWRGPRSRAGCPSHGHGARLPPSG